MNPRTGLRDIKKMANQKQETKTAVYFRKPGELLSAGHLQKYFS
jgi:hypothetical protein